MNMNVTLSEDDLKKAVTCWLQSQGFAVSSVVFAVDTEDRTGSQRVGASAQVTRAAGFGQYPPDK